MRVSCSLGVGVKGLLSDTRGSLPLKIWSQSRFPNDQKRKEPADPPPPPRPQASGAQAAEDDSEEEEGGGYGMVIPVMAGPRDPDGREKDAARSHCPPTPQTTPEIKERQQK